MAYLNIDLQSCRYQAMLGVGGIGTGVFFALNDDHTLGREESRSGHFLNRRDYCKLHIISHYVKVLLGEGFEVIPIGKVGNDAAGQQLLKEMREIGLNVSYVESCPGEQTLYSFCFSYPDGSGGNLTVDDSACSKVNAQFIDQVEPEFARMQGKAACLAAPEVPLQARQKLLELGTKHQFYRVAALTSAEILPALDMGLLGMMDLLVLNLDEASVLAELPRENEPAVTIVEAAIRNLQKFNPALWTSITAGREGSWAWDGSTLNHIPAFLVPVVSTAGAGDAFLAGVIAGLVAGLTFFQAQELGSLVAALSVTSPHTIHPGIERQSLLAFSFQENIPLSKQVYELLREV